MLLSLGMKNYYAAAFLTDAFFFAVNDEIFLTMMIYVSFITSMDAFYTGIILYNEIVYFSVL